MLPSALTCPDAGLRQRDAADIQAAAVGCFHEVGVAHSAGLEGKRLSTDIRIDRPVVGQGGIDDPQTLDSMGGILGQGSAELGIGSAAVQDQHARASEQVTVERDRGAVAAMTTVDIDQAVVGDGGGGGEREPRPVGDVQDAPHVQRKLIDGVGCTHIDRGRGTTIGDLHHVGAGRVARDGVQAPVGCGLPRAVNSAHPYVCNLSRLDTNAPRHSRDDRCQDQRMRNSVPVPTTSHLHFSCHGQILCAWARPLRAATARNPFRHSGLGSLPS